MLVAVVLWSMCCHTGMPRRRHRTWYPGFTPSQYTNTGPTCGCAIHWCGTSHWNTQLPILMSSIRPVREILPCPSIHTSERSTLCTGMLVVSRQLGRKYRTNRVLNPGPVMCEFITLSARPLLLLIFLYVICNVL